MVDVGVFVEEKCWVRCVGAWFEAHVAGIGFWSAGEFIWRERFLIKLGRIGFRDC